MSTLISQGYRLSEGQTFPRQTLSAEAMEQLREGLATCRSRRGLTPEARLAIQSLSSSARREGWAPEQFVVAVKDACSASTEISHLTVTSEREAFLARIITACIQEYFRDGRAD